MATSKKKAPAKIKKAAGVSLRPLKVPPRFDSQLPGGLKVIASHRGQLPLLSLRLVISGGTSVNPADRPGVADMTARLLRRGTLKQSADALNDAVEMYGAGISIGTSEDLFVLSITTPSKHFRTMLDVMGEIVREPAFAENEVESARNRMLAQLSTDLDDPGTIAQRGELLAYWGDHPYGHDSSGNIASVKAITRDDLVRYSREQLGPARARLVMVGDIDPEQAVEAAEQAFAGWDHPTAPIPDLPEVTRPVRAGRILVIDKPDQTQTQLRVVGTGVRKGHPDYFSIVAFNTVLGGSFTSRLVREVRVKRGLSYGANSHFDTLRAGGLFAATTFTKNESTREALDVVLTEVDKMRAKGPTPTELDTAKRFVSALYPARLETNEALANAFTEIDLYGLQPDWIEQYRDRLLAVTQKQAAQSAATYLPDESRVIVLVGKASDIVPQVESLGPVDVMKATELV